MSWIKAKPLNQYPWYVRFLFWLQKKKYGKILESSKIWARSPRIFLGLSAFYGAIDRKSSLLPPQLRAFIMVHVSQMNNCSFCVALNSEIFGKLGGSEEKLAQLQNFGDSPLFSEKEKVALTYAEAMTDSNQKTSDSLVSQLKKHFSEDEIVELTSLIAFQNCSNLFNNSLMLTE